MGLEVTQPHCDTISSAFSCFIPQSGNVHNPVAAAAQGSETYLPSAMFHRDHEAVQLPPN